MMNFASTDTPVVGYENLALSNITIQDVSPPLSQTTNKHETANENRAVTTDELLSGWTLLQMYGRQTLQVDYATDSLPLRTLPERLAMALLDLSNELASLIQNLSCQTLADQLGTCRETIGALLRAFRRQGFIDVGYRHIQILDVESPQDLSSASA